MPDKAGSLIPYLEKKNTLTNHNLPRRSVICLNNIQSGESHQTPPMLFVTTMTDQLAIKLLDGTEGDVSSEKCSQVDFKRAVGSKYFLSVGHRTEALQETLTNNSKMRPVCPSTQCVCHIDAVGGKSKTLFLESVAVSPPRQDKCRHTFSKFSGMLQGKEVRERLWHCRQSLTKDGVRKSNLQLQEAEHEDWGHSLR